MFHRKFSFNKKYFLILIFRETGWTIFALVIQTIGRTLHSTHAREICNVLFKDLSALNRLRDCSISFQYCKFSFFWTFVSKFDYLLRESHKKNKIKVFLNLVVWVGDILIPASLGLFILISKHFPQELHEPKRSSGSFRVQLSKKWPCKQTQTYKC